MYMFRGVFLSFLLCLWCFAESGDGARIMASISVPSFSHQVAYRTIWKELARRGHEIVLLTTDPMEGRLENIKQINLSHSYEIVDSFKLGKFLSNDVNKNFWKLMKLAVQSMIAAHRYQLLHPEVQELINNSSERFDLLMLEVVFPLNMAYVERFKNVPVIGLSSLDASRIVHDLMGNDDNPIIHPQLGCDISPTPTLLERTDFSGKMLVIRTIFIVLCTAVTCSQARILASIPTPSYSHQIVFRPLWKELAKKGHEIVLLTCDPMKEKIDNIQQIDLGIGYQVMEKHEYNKLISTEEVGFSIFNKMMQIVRDILVEELLLPDVQQLIHNKSEKFDLLIHETGYSVHVAFAERFDIPVIAVSSMDVPHYIHGIMGNDVHPALHQDLGNVLGFKHPLSITQRIVSVLFNGMMNAYGHFIVNPMMDEIIQQVFGKNSKSIMELMKEVDMLFINVNPVLHPIRAVTPNTIMFGGGTHVDTVPKPLPEGIRKFLDDATDGVIYFSLGSNVKSNLIRDELRRVFIETFKELPYKILWKFENEELPNKPDNVMIQKWVPQADVLRHPNIKVFITQCGLQSMEEAIMNHIPLIGLPFFADQPANAIMMHNKGFGVHLDHTKLTKDQFKETIVEVITNPKYKQKSMEIADLLTDVEMTGLEKVVWWTEYVIRNKGAKLFRNPIRDLPFYQYYLLDVIGFVGVLCFIVIFGSIKITLLIYRLVRQMIAKKPKKD